MPSPAQIKLVSDRHASMTITPWQPLPESRDERHRLLANVLGADDARLLHALARNCTRDLDTDVASAAIKVQDLIRQLRSLKLAGEDQLAAALNRLTDVHTDIRVRNPATGGGFSARGCLVRAWKIQPSGQGKWLVVGIPTHLLRLLSLGDMPGGS